MDDTRGNKNKGKHNNRKLSDDKKDKKRLVLETHEDFAKATHEIFQRLNDNPDLAKLLLVNPVLAIEELDVELSQELRHHVMHALQHPPKLRERRAELEASLTKALGQTPKPNNEEWLADVIFNQLDVEPLNTSHRTPVYKRVVSDTLVNYAQNIRERWERSKTNPRRSRPKGGKIRFKTPGDKIRRMDLDAPVPKNLKQLEETPTALSLEDLYFYRDQNPIINDLLELGIIQRRAFPIQSADGYRKVKNGDQASVFTTWIKSATFKSSSEG